MLFAAIILVDTTSTVAPTPAPTKGIIFVKLITPVLPAFAPYREKWIYDM